MQILKNNINIPHKGDFLALSVSEREALYNHLSNFIDLIDAKSLQEILDGTNSDINKVFNIILEETNNILNLKRFKDSDVSLLNQLPEVKRSYEEYLRKANLNYFVNSVLPNFEMNWHNIEWFNMIQLYQYLCIIAARDHSKSYSFSFAYVLWRLYRYTRSTPLIQVPDDIKFYKEGMLITNEFKLAKKLLKKVKEEIQYNDILREALYPDKNTGGWANESLTCKNGAELTLSSFRTSNRGPHPGWIVVDDFLDKSVIYSKEQREKFIDVFHGEIMNMLLPQGQCLVVGCVGLDTIVLTERGFTRMRDLAPKLETFDSKKLYDLYLNVLDKKGWSTTSKYFINGLGPMKRVTLKGGYSLNCSLVHPLYRMDTSGIPSWVNSSELKIGDWVGLRKNNSDFGIPISLKDFKKSQSQYCYNIKCLDLPDYLDEDLSYLIGLWIAEGSIYKLNNSVEISTGDIEIIDFLYSLKEKYGIKFKKTADFSYVCVSKNLVNLLSYLGIFPTHCNEKKIPSQLMCAEKSILKSLISGIFDGDGSSFLSKKGYLEISLSSTSKDLVSSLQSILFMGWGLKSILHKTSLKKLKSYSRKGVFNCNFPQFVLDLHGEDARRFCEDIGFRLKRKQQNFLISISNPRIKELIPYQFKLYDSINRKRIREKIFYDKSKPKILNQFYQRRDQVAISKSDLLKVIEYWESLGLKDEDLLILKSNCESDIIWKPITSIEDIFDYSVDFVIPKTHSFITNGIISHNTLFHEKDLYANLKSAPKWRVFEYPAIFPDGSLLWKNRYNFEALKNKRITFGSVIFSREILVRPISDSTSIFPWSILETSFRGMDKYILVDNIISFPIKFKKISTGVDLALSSESGADYTVITTTGEDEIGNIWLLNLTRLHGARYNQQIATLQLINHNFSPDVILMENNVFQKVMADLGRDAGLDNIAEFTTGNNKKDLYEGLPSLAVLFERGMMRFPRGNEKSIEITNLLCGELNSITFDDDRGKLESVSEHDDAAMSLFLSIKGLRYVNSGIYLSMI